MNDTNDLFEYDIKSIDKLNQTSFKVDLESDLKVDLTNEYHFWVKVFYNKEGEEDFSDEHMIQIPKQEVCEFVNTTYRKYLWEKIKDYSNLPEPGTCPIKAGHYYLKDYTHNADKFKMYLKPGLIKVEMFFSQDHEESHITLNGVSVYVKVDLIEE